MAFSFFQKKYYYFNGQTTQNGDICNPYTYILWGGILIDEVIAEYVATRMVYRKFNCEMPSFLEQ